MTVKITPASQNRQVFIRLNGMGRDISKAIHDSLFEVGKENVNHVKKLMLERKTGRTYKINGRDHQASSPFVEAPAILSGDLLRSLDYEVRGSSEMEFGDTSMKNKAPYGKFLEEGTKNKDGSVRMKKRPHISRTVQEKYKDTFNTLEGYVKRGLGV